MRGANLGWWQLLTNRAFYVLFYPEKWAIAAHAFTFFWFFGQARAFV